MKQLLTTPLVITTLALNLLCGNFLIYLLNKGDVRATVIMLPTYSLTALALLVWGFSRIRSGSGWWLPPLLGTLCSLSVPFLGSALWAIAMSLPEEGLLTALGKGIVLGVFGLIGGVFFAIPFVLGNTLAFFLRRRTLRRLSRCITREAECLR